MNSQVPISDPFPPRPPIPGAIPAAPSAPPSAARWRWWASLLLIGVLPILAALSSLTRRQDDGSPGAMLPADVPGLMRYCALQLGIFAVLYGLSWALSRASRDQLWLRFSGAKDVAWGVGYSVLMRLALMVLMIAVLIALAMAGLNIKAIMATVQSNSEGVRDAIGPAFASHDPLFRFLLITVIAFVLAGLREELWRSATMAGILHLAPARWTEKAKIGVALGVSSVLFGMGHIYQGPTGVLQTTVLGVVLGSIILRHRSVWPAIIAHGCFDAVSFAALAAMQLKK